MDGVVITDKDIKGPQRCIISEEQIYMTFVCAERERERVMRRGYGEQSIVMVGIKEKKESCTVWFNELKLN
jgi:hypothetical protein